METSIIITLILAGLGAMWYLGYNHSHIYDFFYFKIIYTLVVTIICFSVWEFCLGRISNNFLKFAYENTLSNELQKSVQKIIEEQSISRRYYFFIYFAILSLAAIQFVLDQIKAKKLYDKQNGSDNK